MIVRHCDAEAELAGPQVSFYVVLKSALSVLTRERHMRGSGGSLDPLGLFLCASTPCIWSTLEYPERLPTLC